MIDSDGNSRPPELDLDFVRDTSEIARDEIVLYDEEVEKVHDKVNEICFLC
jgi:hypothetical protein